MNTILTYSTPIGLEIHVGCLIGQWSCACDGEILIGYLGGAKHDKTIISTCTYREGSVSITM